MTTTLDVWREYSLAERDRRWNTVRARAAAADLDCIFVPLGNGTDARYLTHIKGAVQSAAMVLPTDPAREPLVISEYPSNQWVPNPRPVRRAWAEPQLQMLLDAGMERARIGVVGLKGGIMSHVRQPDGVVNESPFALIEQRLPHATFVDATDVVGFVRAVKSAEEIACLRRSTEIAEAAIAAMVEAAQPGRDAAAVYAAAMERMLEMGSEFYPLALRVYGIDAPPGPRLTEPPFGITLQVGTQITNEVSALWGHQVSQEDQPIVIGPIPEHWKPVIELQREVFEAGLELMRPGTTYGELIDLVNGFGKARGMRTQALMHGRGYGDDGPLIVGDALRPEARDLPLEEGNAFVFKPIAYSADGRLEFTWGGDVVVTARGAERLFSRTHGVIATG